MSNNTWEEPFIVGDKTEPVQSFEAFQIWLEMGSKRSLKAVAERVEKSHDTIKKYSCTWKWSERLQDKLTYENKKIHGKQLESMLSSLNVDNKRDLLIQTALGNLATTIVTQSMSTNLGDFRTDFKKMENKLSNPRLEYLERVLNMYCKLEKIHNEHQKKYIHLNNECLQYSNFDKEEDYVAVMENGEKNQSYILSGIMGAVASAADENNSNAGGVAILKSPDFKPVEPFTSAVDNKEVTGEDKKCIEE